MADLVSACLNAICYFNMKSQSKLSGLNQQDDDLRQKLCNAASAATGQVYCGNLNRIHESNLAIDYINKMID